MLRILHRAQFLQLRKMSVFTQYPNNITGEMAWEQRDENYDYHQEVARSAFADMLHDHERNHKYFIALKKAIETMHKKGKKANVLDIGTGTGLLSMMAAKCNADTIVACEAFKPMATCAAKILSDNNMEDKIQLIYKRSNMLTVGENGDLKQRANILVTEVFDTELIGEGALSTFRHAQQYLLEEDCIVVPSKGTVWAQVIQSSLVQSWNKVDSLKDPDNEDVLLNVPSLSKSCSGAAAVHDIQLSCLPYTTFTPLLPPVPIFRFDWTGKEPLVFDETKRVMANSIESGAAHAVFMWWDLDMDMDGDVKLSCAPVWEHPDVKEQIKESTNLEELAEKIPWRDHWMQAIYYLPTETKIEKNKQVALIGCHDEYSFWFHVDNKEPETTQQYEKPICRCCVHLGFSRTRIGQLNDQKRNDQYIRALKKRVTNDSTVVCISDGSLLGLTALKLGAKKVVILETNYLSRRTIESFVPSELAKKVDVIDAIDKLPPSEQVDLVFAEPYFVTSILPWDNLRFWYILSNYSTKVSRMPISCTVNAVAVEFKDLHKIRAPLGICEGFDMKIFDRLLEDSSRRSDSSVEAQPLWEYPCRALSPPFEIMTFDFTQDVNSQQNATVSSSVNFVETGLCNGVAVWVDWQLDPTTTVSTGPTEKISPGKKISWDRYTRQGVHLLENIRSVKNGDKFDWSFNFLPKDGKLQFTVSPK